MPAKKTDADVLETFSMIMPSGCIEWTGSIDRCGYGKMRRGRETLAHRFAYSHERGAIPPGMEIDHLCKNRKCINVEHLDVVSRIENMVRSDVWKYHRNRDKTHCKRGHEFTPENTALEYYGERTQRKCRTCRNDAQRARYVAKG